MQIHPYTRLAVLCLGVTGCVLSCNLLELGIFELIMLPILIGNTSIKIVIIFFQYAILPMMAMFFLFHLLTGSLESYQYSHEMLIVAKLIVITTLIQIAFIIPLKFVHFTFRKWGFKGSSLMILVGSYFVWVDVVKRSQRILIARFSQGYIQNRTFISKIRQMPFIIIPLIIGILRTASERSDMWNRKDIRSQLDTAKFSEINGKSLYNLSLYTICIVWVLYNILKYYSV